MSCTSRSRPALGSLSHLLFTAMRDNALGQSCERGFNTAVDCELKLDRVSVECLLHLANHHQLKQRISIGGSRCDVLGLLLCRLQTMRCRRLLCVARLPMHAHMRFPRRGLTLCHHGLASLGLQTLWWLPALTARRDWTLGRGRFSTTRLAAHGLPMHSSGCAWRWHALLS